MSEWWKYMRERILRMRFVKNVNPKRRGYGYRPHVGR